MKTRYLFILALATIFSFSSCKKDLEKVEAKEVKKEIAIADLETVSLNVTGMTCQIGCAKKIQSDLSKKDGVASAKVIFKDSTATIEYDKNKTSKEDLIAFIGGIAGGDLYTATEIEETATEK